MAKKKCRKLKYKIAYKTNNTLRKDFILNNNLHNIEYNNTGVYELTCSDYNKLYNRNCRKKCSKKNTHTHTQKSLQKTDKKLLRTISI